MVSARLRCEGTRSACGKRETNTDKQEPVAHSRILSTVATGEGASFGRHQAWVKDEALRQSIQRALEDRSMVEPARAHLRDYILGLDSQIASIAVAHTLQSLGVNAALSKVGDAAVRELFAAAAVRWLTVDHASLDEYDRLIAERQADELAFQHFFERYPQFLDPMATTLWPRPDFHGFREPDFVIRRADDSYLVIEIETPAKSLMAGSNPPRLSAECTNAEAQILEYRRFLNGRLDEVRHHFPRLANVEGLAVIGIESGLTEGQRLGLAAFNESKHGVRIVGFDWLKQRAIAIRENLLRANLDVRTARIV